MEFTFMRTGFEGPSAPPCWSMVFLSSVDVPTLVNKTTALLGEFSVA